MSKSSDSAASFFGCIFMILWIGYGISQIYAGFVGIEHGWGQGWAWGVVVACIYFEISLPLTVAAFFCAKNVWGWHWALAFLFAAPGLAFTVMSFSATLIDAVRKK